LEFGYTRNNDADREHVELVEQSEVVKVAVVEFGLVIPLDFNSDPILEIVDFMRGSRVGFAVHHNLNVEPLLRPPTVL